MRSVSEVPAKIPVPELKGVGLPVGRFGVLEKTIVGLADVSVRVCGLVTLGSVMEAGE